MENFTQQYQSIDLILKERWGYKDFKYPQREIIDTVFNCNNVIAIMPTGFGKSLCYQILALISPNPVLVISPLLSLIQDQIYEAKKLNIKAVSINSSNTEAENQDAFLAIHHNSCDLVYISPERISSRYFLAFIADKTLSAIVIDEAHCVSHWGRGFRPSYLEITKLTTLFPNSPILALTATASAKIIKDVAIILRFKDYKLYKANLYRSNLSVNTIHRTNKKRTLLNLFELSQSSIIYLRNKSKCEKLSDYLRNNNIKAAAYHAGMDHAQRLKVQEDWQSDLISCIVATNAFGMGINKKDVRNIIHYEIPASMTDYVQEIGRAGRDGLASTCTILFNNQDIKFKIKSHANTKESKAKNDIEEVLQYIKSLICRQKSILNYFDDELNTNCGNCDNCIDISDFSQMESMFMNELEGNGININHYFSTIPLQVRNYYLTIVNQLYEEKKVSIKDGYLMLN